eukprot:TRINITY_DN18921_c0_g1_i1.p1 TRINITY_DN18921_c0_g1~~TRINITY_DN18921_c0_g1_i1.p1  ORF type:complete len:2249 (-),score=502.27 TRINITY_DN18921_c0_g1_i1:24-6605(-)
MRGADRLSIEVEDLKAKVAALSRENRKQKDLLEQKDRSIKRVLDDMEKLRKDPSLLNPGVKRLRKLGLNTPQMAELDDRWAGYVFGRTSMAMEAGSYAIRNVFLTHAVNGVLTEESFRAVIRQFEPSIKSDQLTRLWFFADLDNSGKIDLFEFMRMVGCTSNGDMSEEYYEVMAVHLYKKFQARGGVRRACATFQDMRVQRLSVNDFIKFITSCFKDLDFTKREMRQVFEKMDVTGSGTLSVVELEEALEAAGAKVLVSEIWVKEVFQQLAVAVQDAGTSLKQLLPGTVVTVKDFRDLTGRFLSGLRPSQIDRLWKYLQSVCTDHHAQLRHSGGDKDRLSVESVLSTVFGLTLTSTASDDPNLALQQGGPGANSTQRPGVCREALEQVVQQLVQRVGEASPESCFDALEPFLTPDHFKEMLSARLGLHFDATQSRQIFRMIDNDRDGKITRNEFHHMVKSVLPDIHRESWDFSEESLEKDNERHQANRLQNRLRLLERELLLLRGSSTSKAGVAPEPMVPERQFQQLSVAHGKVSHYLQVLRSQMQAAGAGAVKMTSLEANQVRRMSLSRSSPRPSIIQLPAQRQVQRQAEQRLLQLTAPLSREKGEDSVTFGSDSEQSHGPNAGCNEADLSKVKELEHVRLQDAQTFKVQLEALLAANEFLRRRVRKLHDGTTRNGSNPFESIQDRDEDAADEEEDFVDEVSEDEDEEAEDEEEEEEEDLQVDELEELNMRRSSALSDASSGKLRVKSSTGKVASSLKDRRISIERRRASRSYIYGAAEQVELARTLVADQEAKKKRAILEQVIPVGKKLKKLMAIERLQLASMFEEPLPKAEELFGTLHIACFCFQHALKRRPDTLEKIQKDLERALANFMIEGRWKCESVMAASARMVALLCYDSYLSQQVVLKTSQSNEAARQLAYTTFALKLLEDVPVVPRVHYFSSPYSSLPYVAMELLEGDSLETLFQRVQSTEAELMSIFEATEVGDALLRGLDACHHRQVLNLGLCPDNVWVGPPLKGSRVRVLDWSAAEVNSASVINPDFRIYEEERRKGSLRSEGLPVFFRTDTGKEVPLQDLLPARHKGYQLRQQATSNVRNLAIRGHGSLSYMSMEQMYNLIRSMERPSSKPAVTQSWFQDTIGNVAKIDGANLHWFQKGDGFAQTTSPVGVTPLGQFFEVEIQKVAHVGRRISHDLGFCLGLTWRPPKSRKAEENRSERPEKQECWIAGGDCCFYLLGQKHNVAQKAARRVDDEEAPSLDAKKYLHVPEELRKGDRVALLAEWDGSLSLFLNGKQVGHLEQAIDPCEVMVPLYGIVDLFIQGNDEYSVRSVSLVNSEEGGLAENQKMKQAATVLGQIHKFFHDPTTACTVTGVSCDLYACGRILLQCFMGGRELLPSLNMDKLAVALSVWASSGCPSTEKSFGLLWALKELKMEKTERSKELSQIANPDIRQVISRCVKRSRHSRFASCWEAADKLAAAASWTSMSPDFLCSHEVAVEQAKREYTLDAHYAAAQERQKKEMQQSDTEEDTIAVHEASIAAKWNLRPYVLGCSHFHRVVQVLQAWSHRKCIQAVAVSKFEKDISEHLQETFMSCVMRESPAVEKNSNSQQVPKEDTNFALNVGEEKKPLLFLDSFRLPAVELPRLSFPPQQILSRNILWLVVLNVSNLDLTPLPCGLGHDEPFCVGTYPGAMEILASAMPRSPFLRNLSLRSSRLGEQGGLTLAAAVEECLWLRELDLRDNKLGPKAGAKILHAARENVMMLDLSRNEIGDAGAKAIAEELGNCRDITDLRMRKNGIGNDGGEALCEALMCLASLQDLDMAENDFGVQVAAALLRAATACRTLKRLCLDGNSPWPLADSHEAQVAAFTDQLGGHLAVPSLTHLSLRRCGLKSGSASKLFESMTSNCTLKSLNVAGNGIRQTAAGKIAACLAAPSSGLEEVDLRDNSLGVQDAIAIAFYQKFCYRDKQASQESATPAKRLVNQRTRPEKLDMKADGDLAGGLEIRAQNCKLRSLNLANNQISAAATEKLSDVLLNFQAIQEILMYHNPQMGDEGAKALAKLFQPGRFPPDKGILQFNLASCCIGDAGCEALCSELENDKTLQLLDLSCNNITDDSAPKIAQVLSLKESHLESVVLSMNCFSSKGVLQLVEGVARNLDGSLRTLDVAAQSPPGGGDSSLAGDESVLLGPDGAKVKAKVLGIH